MEKEFSKNWKGSKQPRKQRKFLANAPIHIRRKQLSVNLSKDLRKTSGKRNIPIVKGDTVKIMRGKFKKKTGKILSVFSKQSRVEIEGIQIKKQDGSKVNVKLRTSNLQIIELNTKDSKRKVGLKTEDTKKEDSSKTGGKK